MSDEWKKVKDLGEDLGKDIKKGIKKDVKNIRKGVEKGVKKDIKNNDWLPWALIIALFILGLSPIALILLLVKLFGKDGKKNRISPENSQSFQEVGDGQPGRARAAVGKVTRSPVAKTSTAKWLKIGGGVVMLLSLLANLDYLMWFLGGDTFWWEEVVRMAMGLVAGGAMFFAGRGMSRSLKRYAKYLTVLGDREAMALEEIARVLGYSRRRVEKDLQKMIDQGYFGGEAYLHVERGYLIRSGRAEEALQAQEKQEAPMPSGVAETEYAGLLRKIRYANDRIEDPELSAKIDRLEEITARIFRAVELDPKKRSRIDTFLNYYLPTTQKLLDSYAEFENAGVEGENLRQAKQRIEKTMDKIVNGFEHQLDELYKSEAMDVDQDIRVMESMLRWNTASVEKDFGSAVERESK